MKKIKRMHCVFVVFTISTNGDFSEIDFIKTPECLLKYENNFIK